MGRTAFGLDIGGTKTLGLAVDAPSGEVLAEHRVATPEGGGAVLEALASLVDELSRLSGRAPEAVGVGAAGLVDVDGVLRYGPNLPGVIAIDIVGALHDHTGVPVAVDNDATAATVAEHRLGAARGVDDALYVALGTGIGGGLVLDGAVRRGAHGFAAEIGHLVIQTDGPVCGCGQRGCWERLASGSALGQLARVAARDGTAPRLVELADGEASVEGRHAVAAAGEGDPGGLAVLDEFSRWVALGLAGLVNVLDPALIVIGGGVVEAGAVLMDPLRRQFGGMVVGADHRPPVQIQPAELGVSAAAVGAALLALDRV